MQELAEIRKKRGLSQQGLSDASGVNKATINQIERGRRSPNVETLEKLAKALGVEVADLFPKTAPPLPFERSAQDAGSAERGSSMLADTVAAAVDRWARETSDRGLDAPVALGIAMAAEILADLLDARLGGEESWGLTGREMGDVARVQAKLDAVEASRRGRVNDEMELEALHADLRERVAAWKVPTNE